MVDIAEVLRHLQTTNRYHGGGGLMGLTEPQALPDHGPVPTPGIPPSVPPGQLGVDVLPQMPPVGPQLTVPDPTWGEAGWAGLQRLAPQVMETQEGIRSGLGHMIAEGGPGVMAAKRYGGGTWREGLAKAGADMDAVAQGIMAMPSALKETYLTERGLKKHVAEDPMWALLDVAGLGELGLAPLRAGARAASRTLGGGIADEQIARHLAQTPIKPPMVQGMLESAAPTVPGMAAPDVRGIGIFNELERLYGPAAGAPPRPGWGEGATLPEAVPGGPLAAKQREIDIANDIQRIMAEQERMQHYVGISQPKSLGQVHMPSLQEPAAFDTMGRHLQLQDMRKQLIGTEATYPEAARGQPQAFQPLKEMPPANTVQRVLAEQEAAQRLVGAGRTQDVRSMPSWRLHADQEPGPRTLEREMGVMQPLRGTPTLDTATIDMANTRLGEEIRLLRERRAYATNKHDRKWYDDRVQELQDAMLTPDATADDWSGGMYGFVRTRHPEATDFPFRRTRYSDAHPREYGETGPQNTKAPGTYVKTHGGKRWEWQKGEPPPSAGEATVRGELGTEFAEEGRPVRWTGTTGGGGGRGWRLTPQAPQMIIGRGRPAPAARPPAQPVEEAGGQLRMPGVRSPIPQRTVNPEHASAVVYNNILDRIYDWQRMGGARGRADELMQAARKGREDVFQARQQPPPPEPQGLLAMPDPALGGVHPDQPLLRPATSEYAHPPGPGTFVREDGAIKWKPEEPEGLLSAPEKDPNQIPMFGLPRNLDPFTKQGAETFTQRAPDLPWSDYIDPKKFPNNAVSTNTQPGADQINANKTLKVGYEGDLADPYFYKWTDPSQGYGTPKLEVAASDAGRMMGVDDMIPAVMVAGDENAFVTPWINGEVMRNNPNLAKDIILKMDPVKRTRKTLWEFIVADTDKHPGNWMIHGDMISGIDYGGALRGDHRSMLHPPGRGNVNKYYQMLEEHFTRFNPNAPIEKEVLADFILKQPDIVAVFKKAGANQMDLDRLRLRYSKLKSLDLMDNPTYTDLRKIVDGL